MKKVRFDFWLDADKPEELALMNIIRTLRGKKQFLPTIRTALVLVPSLDEGDHAVLQQKYPEVVEKLAAGQGGNDDPPPTPPVGGTDIMQEVRRGVEQGIKEGVRQVILETPASYIPDTSKDYPKMQKAAEKPLVASPVPIAEIKAGVIASADTIADNFLSMFQ